jgi:thymidylate synthase (FAD)
MRCELIDSMGSDLTVVNAARVSFDKQSDWAYAGLGWYEDSEPPLKKEDAGLVKYLAKHDHFTPFTHCMITLRETVPIFVARQRFKHTVGFSYNEVSRRYVDANPAFYFPLWRLRAENKKQGSDGNVDKRHQHEATCAYEEALKACEDCYMEMIKSGIAPEQARIVLPQSMYTSYYVTGSLAAFARAYKLRSQSDAQVEIQELSKQWSDIIEPLFPVSWKALTE